MKFNEISLTKEIEAKARAKVKEKKPDIVKIQFLYKNKEGEIKDGEKGFNHKLKALMFIKAINKSANMILIGWITPYKDINAYLWANQ